MNIILYGYYTLSEDKDDEDDIPLLRCGSGQLAACGREAVIDLVGTKPLRNTLHFTVLFALRQSSKALLVVVHSEGRSLSSTRPTPDGDREEVDEIRVIIGEKIEHTAVIL